MKEIKSGYDPITGFLNWNRTASITTLDDISDEFNALVSNKILPVNLKILDDARDNQIAYSTKSLAVLIDKFENAIENFVSVRHAVVHRESGNMFYTVLIGNMIKSKKYSLEVFLTVDAAKKWLEL